MVNKFTKWFSRNKFKIFFLVILVIALSAIEITGICTSGFYSNQDVGFLLMIRGPLHIVPLIYVILIAPFVLITRRRYDSLLLFMVLVSLFSFANAIYLRVFKTIIPFEMYGDIENLKGLGNSIMALLCAADILYFAVPMTVISAYYLFFYKKITETTIRDNIFILLLLIVVTLPQFLIMNFVFEKQKYKVTCIERLREQLDYNEIEAYRYCGYSILVSKELTKESAIINYTKEDIADIEAQINTSRANTLELMNSMPRIEPRQNMVVIILESMNTKVVDVKVGDRYVAPTMHRLSQQKSTLFCPQMKCTEQAGNSIGGFFATMSGMSGLRNVSPFNVLVLNKYPSLAELIRLTHSDIVSETICGSSKTLWRQNVANVAVGIDNIYGMDEIIPERFSYQFLKDDSLFTFANQRIDSISDKQFFLCICTTDTHLPYDNIEECDLDFPETMSHNLKSYYSKAHKTDIQIERFINKLKQKNVYDNTLIVLVGDHNAPSLVFDSVAFCDQPLSENSLSNFIFAMFVNTGADMTNFNRANRDNLYVQPQIYPTVAQLMDIRNASYYGVYPSVLDTMHDRLAPDADILRSSTHSAMIKTGYKISDLIIRGSYFGTYR